ncbi:MAG: hypothetical protein RLZZ324_1012 [Candidatus Parcubacteria bacterium]|jgi:putative membrane protein
MAILARWIISALAILAAAYFIPGVTVAGFGTALVVALVLGVVNAFIRPILLVLTLPVNILTLGLFTFVINALMILLVSQIVPGFHVSGFWVAMLFSIALGLVSMLIFAVFK